MRAPAYCNTEIGLSLRISDVSDALLRVCGSDFSGLSFGLAKLLRRFLFSGRNRSNFRVHATAARSSSTSGSIFVFGGALSTSGLGSTLKFNLDQPAGRIKYDNYIAGAAYNHNFYYLGFGFVLGAEVGVADRFGHYAICCDTIIKSSSFVNSGELWAGPRISYEGFVLFDTIRIAGAASTGFSFTTNSIGRERERELAYPGSARALVYFGPEIIISLVNHPELEFVYRVQHRSGANGTFGNMREGYNANVFGIRYKF
jgi:hypothetical protein